MTSRHVWSQRYDQLLEDIFSVQDEIMMNIMRAMDVSVVGLGRLKDQPIPQSVEAYFKILKALELVYHWNKDDNLLARKLYQEAIDLDPEYGTAYEQLGWTYYHEAMRHWTHDPAGSLGQAEELGKKAISLGNPLAHMLLGFVYSSQGQNDKAIAEGEKALSINPNTADLNIVFGLMLSYAGRHEEAIERAKKAIRLNPHHQPWYIGILSVCYFQAGMIEKTIESFQRQVKLSPNHLLPWRDLAGLYAMVDRDEEAKKAAEEVHRIDPGYSWDNYAKGRLIRINDKDIERRFFDGLRKVGLK